jgi:CheY-like chemotaxis protein
MMESRTPLRVLIADDDKLLAEFLAALVAAAGHQVVAVETAGGLSVVQSYAQHRPDCVLLDVMMPRLNGCTVAHHLRSRDPAVRIIMMSGMALDDLPAVKQCRPNGWLTKPIAFDTLREALEKIAA